MDNNDKRIYGIRCKQARDTKGITQQELANLISTSPQNISKYEREGISDIFVIKELSKALDTDLLQEKLDAEGTVGEIGKEILLVLAENNGYIDIGSLMKNHMYGMSLNRVTLEIKKLVDIGMCVREAYNDWLSEKRDGLFITAKGLITLKNLKLNKKQSKKVKRALNKINTYERLLGDFCSYQDYINSRPGEKLIRQFGYKGFEPLKTSKLCIDNCYRANYIEYLHRNFETGLEKTYDFFSESSGEESLNPGFNCYHDILYRMALGITNEILWKHELCGDEEYFFSQEYNELKIDLGLKEETEAVLLSTLRKFENEFYWVEEYTDDGYEDKDNESTENIETIMFSKLRKELDEMREHMEVLKERCNFEENETEFSKEIYELANSVGVYEEKMDKVKRYIELGDYIDEEIYYECAIPEIYEKHRPDGASKYPTDWFTKEEIKQFINENMGPAVTEQEKEIDRILKKVNHYMPETLDYYRFPKEWEENGLADLVRKNCGLIK